MQKVSVCVCVCNGGGGVGPLVLSPRPVPTPMFHTCISKQHSDHVTRNIFEHINEIMPHIDLDITTEDQNLQFPHILL